MCISRLPRPHHQIPSKVRSMSMMQFIQSMLTPKSAQDFARSQQREVRAASGSPHHQDTAKEVSEHSSFVPSAARSQPFFFGQYSKTPQMLQAGYLTGCQVGHVQHLCSTRRGENGLPLDSQMVHRTCDPHCMLQMPLIPSGKIRQADIVRCSTSEELFHLGQTHWNSSIDTLRSSIRVFQSSTIPRFWHSSDSILPAPKFLTQRGGLASISCLPYH